MRKVLIALAALLCLCLTSIPSQATDATSAWNSVCATYHFGSYPQGIHTTFAQAYSGSDFSADFAAAIAGVSSTCGGPTGGNVLPDEPVNARLTSW